jgi:hypothetical protein
MAKQCPECGQRVPCGGGRTVENAHLMYGLVRALTARLKPGEEGAWWGVVGLNH